VRKGDPVTETPVTVACVGAGYFAQLHIDAWKRLRWTRLVAVCDIDLDKARASGVKAFDDPGRMLENMRPDVLDIVLPPHAQAAVLEQAVAAGVPLIICQKPFCRDIGEASRASEAAIAAGVRLVIHENFRFQPWYRAIKAAVDRGEIGTPLQATMRLRPGDGQGPRAYLDRQPYFRDMPRFLIHETGVHFIDVLRFLFGPPTAVYADLRRINPAITGEDAGHVIFHFDGPMRAVFDGNRHLDHAADNTRRTMGEAILEGTGGTLTLTGDGSVRHRAFGARSQTTLLPPDTFSGFGGDCVYHLQAHVVAALTEGAPLENLAESYLDVLRIEEAIYASAQDGCLVHIDPG